jgi:hypothetical protein
MSADECVHFYLRDCDQVEMCGKGLHMDFCCEHCSDYEVRIELPKNNQTSERG